MEEGSMSLPVQLWLPLARYVLCFDGVRMKEEKSRNADTSFRSSPETLDRPTSACSYGNDTHGPNTSCASVLCGF